MGTVQKPDPAALITGITYGPQTEIEKCNSELVEKFGPFAIESDSFDFSGITPYYGPEMGVGLMKRFVCFEFPIHPGSLAEVKHTTNDIEGLLSLDGILAHGRTVNLDPGYVTLSKLVLATTKDYSHRVYIGDSMYAETTLHFEGGTFRPFPHTYPDYKTELAIDFFNRVREYVKESIHTWKQENESKN